MSDIEIVRISETGESPFAVRIESGKHLIIGDEPASAGGNDLGLAPYQLLAAALGECTAMTVRWYARNHDWPVEHIAVEVTHQKTSVEGRPGKTDVFHKTVRLKGDALSEDQKTRLIDVAAKCPVQRTLEATAVIHTSTA